MVFDVGKFVKVKIVTGLAEHSRPLKDLEGKKAEIIKINSKNGSVTLEFFGSGIKETIKKNDADERLDDYKLNKIEKDERKIKKEYELKKGASSKSRSRSRSRAAPKKKSKKSKTIQRLGGGSRRRSRRTRGSRRRSRRTRSRRTRGFRRRGRRTSRR